MNAPPPPSRPLAVTFLAILGPMMLTNILQAAAGTIDGIYVGQLLGMPALAAMSTFFPVFFALLAVVIGLSTGATVLIGQAWGARDLDKVRAVAGTAICLMLGAGLLVGVVGASLAPALMQWLGTPTAILADAGRYARILLSGMPLVFLLWLTTSMSRGVGDAVSPLYTLALAAVFSLLLTPVFILGWAGLPRLGVSSAAVSSLLASTLAMAWMFWFWRRKQHPLAPGPALWPHLRLRAHLARRILQIGLPSCLQMLTMAGAEMVLIGLVNRHGTAATAAYGAVNQIMGWLQLPAMSLGIVSTILAAHTIGAGKTDQLGRIVRTGLWMNLAVTGAMVALAYALAPWAIGWFITDPAVAAVARNLLHIVAWSVVLAGTSNVLVGVMRASGTVLRPMALSIGAIVLLEIPLAYALNTRLGLSGIWWAYALTFASMLLLQAAFYRLVWRHKAFTRLI